MPVTRETAELRGPGIGRAVPPGRDGPVRQLGIERPHVEVLDAVLAIGVVQGGTLAQGTAQQAALITPRALRAVIARSQRRPYCKLVLRT